MKKGNFFLYTGAVIVCIVLLLVIVGFFWTPYSTTEMDGSNKTQPPSISHLLGTDNFGRDIFSRVLEGAGTSCLVAVSVIAIGCGLGIIIGGLCGYYGGLPDLLLTRICDAITAFPSILLALVILSLLDNGMVNIILVLGLLFVPSFARVVRAEFSRCRGLNYVKSAKLMGAGDLRIMVFHILPNTRQVLMPALAIGFNNAILSEASMSFLGLGIQPPNASLGSMLSDSQIYLQSAPWYALGVGGVMVLLILGFGLMTEGLQRYGERD